MIPKFCWGTESSAITGLNETCMFLFTERTKLPHARLIFYTESSLFLKMSVINKLLVRLDTTHDIKKLCFNCTALEIQRIKAEVWNVCLSSADSNNNNSNTIIPNTHQFWPFQTVVAFNKIIQCKMCVCASKCMWLCVSVLHVTCVKGELIFQLWNSCSPPQTLKEKR